MGAATILDMALAGIDESHYAWPSRLCDERGRRAAAAFAVGSDLLHADLLTAIGKVEAGGAPEAEYLEAAGLGFLFPEGRVRAGALPLLEAGLAALEAYQERVASGGDVRCVSDDERVVARHISQELERYLGVPANARELVSPTNN